MNQRRRVRAGYNRRKAAERRFRATELGRLCRDHLSRQEREEILGHGWADGPIGVQVLRGGPDGPAVRVEP